MNILTRSIPSLAAILASALLIACASAPPGEERSSMDSISASEIARLTVTSAYDAIQRLRPRWLRGRGPTNFSAEVSLPVVFVDEVRFGPAQSLQSISLGDVEEMNFMSARDATTRFGTGYPAGIIEIRTKR
jgi:hypothetical protein